MRATPAQTPLKISRIICKSNWVRLRKVDESTVILHLTLGAFKINEEIFAAALGKWRNKWEFFYTSPGVPQSAGATHRRKG